MVKGPFQLDLNPTNKCSDNCVFCFNKKDRHSKVEADSKKIIETIDYLCEHTSLQHIKSSGFGDPLLYKDLWKIFSFAKSKGLLTSLNTNGKNLSGHIPYILKNLDLIRFSIDSFDNNSFKLVHGSNDFDERLKNIALLSKLRNKQNPDLIIGLHYVLIPNNMEGLDKLIDWGIKHKLDYIDLTMGKFIPTFLDNWTPENLAVLSKKLQEAKSKESSDFRIILPQEDTLSQVKLEHLKNQRNNSNTCWQVLLRHFITPSGEYGACNAFDSNPLPKMIFGNINEQPIGEILDNVKSVSKNYQKTSACGDCVVNHSNFNNVCDYVYGEYQQSRSIETIKL